MAYIAKLARRLSLLRPDALGVHSGGMVSLLLLAACAAGTPTASADNGNVPDETKTLFVAPRFITLEGAQAVRFAAYESLIPGSAEVTAIEWTATGGAVAADGSYTPGEISRGSRGLNGRVHPGWDP